MVEVVGPDPDIAVSHHDQLIMGTGQHIQKVGDLRVLAMLAAVGDELNIVIGEAALQSCHREARRIFGAINAEQELDLPPVNLVAERGQIRLQPWLRTIKRLQNCEIGGGGWRIARFLAEASQQHRRKKGID